MKLKLGSVSYALSRDLPCKGLTSRPCCCSFSTITQHRMGLLFVLKWGCDCHRIGEQSLLTRVRSRIRTPLQSTLGEHTLLLSKCSKPLILSRRLYPLAVFNLLLCCIICTNRFKMLASKRNGQMFASKRNGHI